MNLPTPQQRTPSIIRCIGKFFWFLSRGHGPSLAWWLARHDALKEHDYRSVPRPALAAAFYADPSWTDLVAARGNISSRSLGVAFLDDDILRRGYRTWLALAKLGWTFTRTEHSRLLARRGSLVQELTTDEECEMMSEIHLAGCYDLRLPGDWHVVDIGANVGMAALFFAQQHWCRRVISFEPFAPTALAFESNLKLNPTLAHKITVVRQALGEKETALEVDYDPALRGSMSLFGVGAWRGTVGYTQRASIKVVRASDALKPVFAALGSCRLLCKIDCEGSEYPIIRELDSSGELARFSAFVIEWHGSGPDELVTTLIRRGFAVHVAPLSTDNRTLGLIYATQMGLAREPDPPF